MDNLKQKLEEAAVQASLAASMLKKQVSDLNDVLGAAADNAARDLKEASEHIPVQAALGYAEAKEGILDANDQLGALLDNTLRNAREMIDHIPVQAALAGKEIGGDEFADISRRVRIAIEQLAGSTAVQASIAKNTVKEYAADAKDDIGAAIDNAARDAREACEHIPVRAELAREVIRDNTLDAIDVLGAAADNIKNAADELIRSLNR